MKKILSIALAVAFIFAAMSISVFAANPTPEICETCGTRHVVGHTATPHHNNYLDGEDNIPANAKGTHDITIKFGSSTANGGTDSSIGSTNDDDSVIHHKYAVDILYNDFVIDMTKILDTQNNIDVNVEGTPVQYKPIEYVWDVNTHKYVLIGEIVADPNNPSNAPVTQILTDTNDTSYEMIAYKVVNHSDLPIQYKDEIVDPKIPDALTLTTTLNGATDTVNRAKAGVGNDEGSPAISAHDWIKITAKPAGDKHWIDVVNAWGANNDYDEFVVANLVVTITPAT